MMLSGMNLIIYTCNCCIIVPAILRDALQATSQILDSELRKSLHNAYQLTGNYSIVHHT